jgi:hypothetical protein
MRSHIVPATASIGWPTGPWAKWPFWMMRFPQMPWRVMLIAMLSLQRGQPYRQHVHSEQG